MKTKSIFFKIVPLMLALMPLSALSQTMRGDFDMNGKVNISDVTAMVNYLLTDEPASTSAIEHDTIMVKGVPLVMVKVDGGTYTRQLGKLWSVDSFSIGQTEVTIGLWYAVMGTTPMPWMTQELQNPIEDISWNDCQVFIDSLNALTGMSFRLPTEEEWEYAACGGRHTMAYTYAGSNDINEVAWYRGTVPEEEPVGGAYTYFTLSQAVAQLKPNELGLYDMSGNVAELCQNMRGNNFDLNCSLRGGSTLDLAEKCKVTYNTFVSKDKSGMNIGFRLAL